MNLRRARSEGGALRLDQVKLQYSLDPETGLPNGYSVFQPLEIWVTENRSGLVALGCIILFYTPEVKLRTYFGMAFVHPSVCLSVCPSVSHIMSAQYLEQFMRGSHGT